MGDIETIASAHRSTFWSCQNPSRRRFRAERWTFQLQYEGGPIDAEALVVHPEGRHLWIIEKRDEGTTRVFSHTVGALNDEGPTRLSPIVEFPSPGVPIENGRMVTGADLHPSGEHLLVRVYSGIYLYVLAEPFALNTLGQVEPRTITLGPLTEPQGEAIGYDHMGLGFWTISENPNRSGPMALNYFSCPDMPTNTRSYVDVEKRRPDDGQRDTPESGPRGLDHHHGPFRPQQPDVFIHNHTRFETPEFRALRPSHHTFRRMPSIGPSP